MQSFVSGASSESAISKLSADAATIKPPSRRKRGRPSSKHIPPAADEPSAASDQKKGLNVDNDSKKPVGGNSEIATGSKTPKRRRFQDVEVSPCLTTAHETDEVKASLQKIIGLLRCPN